MQNWKIGSDVAKGGGKGKSRSLSVFRELPDGLKVKDLTSEQKMKYVPHPDATGADECARAQPALSSGPPEPLAPAAPRSPSAPTSPRTLPGPTGPL